MNGWTQFSETQKGQNPFGVFGKIKKNVLGVFGLITSPVIDALRLLRDSVQEE